MPNATASLDTDFGFPATGRRKAAQPKPRRKSMAKKQARGPLFDSMPRYGAIAISVLIGVGIVVNALMMQHGHHPAPLFGAVAPAKPAVAAAKPVTKPYIPVAAVEAAPTADPVETPIKPAAHTVAAKTVHGDDAIARLLGGAPAVAPAHKAKSVPDKVASSKPGAAKAPAGKSGTDRHRGRDGGKEE